MTTDRGALAALLATMTMLASASPTLAQTEQTAPVRGLEGLANPTLQANATVPIPDAPKIVLPGETPPPRRTSSPRPANRPATERASAAKASAERPTARNEPEARTRGATDPTRSSTSAEPTPVATPAPEPTVAPPPTQAPPAEATPQPAPQSAPDATPAPTAQPTITAPETGRAMPLWLSLAVIVVVLAGLWVLRRKPRGRRQDQRDVETVTEPTPEPAAPELVSRPVTAAVAATAASVEPGATPAAPAVAAVPTTAAMTAIAAPKFLEPRAKTPPPPPAAPRARVTCDLRPLRAGLNLLSATVECELVVTNTGTAPAEAIRTGIALLTAHAGQDADLARFNAAPIARPATPPFALAPGESRTIRTVVAIARDAIQTMTAANRPMFVPVVATNILYATAGDDAQTARAWVVGIERVDSAKLAPFWLDAPARMFTTVAARPHAATFER